MSDIRVFHGDSRELLAAMPDESVDAVVTDPPYALVSIGQRYGREGAAPTAADVYARATSGFMGRAWDTGEAAFAATFWARCCGC
jgi:site-specific DNA-methyltransferase (adenine-specific)